jgi:hypothetical protein
MAIDPARRRIDAITADLGMEQHDLLESRLDSRRYTVRSFRPEIDSFFLSDF